VVFSKMGLATTLNQAHMRVEMFWILWYIKRNSKK
jgi:hypothetical protein